MATGSASRNSTTSENSLDLEFLALSSDCETWLTGPNEGQNQSESISTQEWLDGALRNYQYDHTKLQCSQMATGSASRNSTTSESSLDLEFLALSSDCETWLTGPNEGQNQSESISTQEWLDGALRNFQYDHTKLQCSQMATGSASRNSTTSESSLDLAFLTLSSDCETWLTGPNEGQNQSESISTQEWLDGALRNSQYDHTKLHRIMQSQKKQKKRVIHDLPSHPSSLLTSVTEEHDKISSRTSGNTYLTSQIDNGSDGEDEFFDASTNFEEEAAAECKIIAPLNNQNDGTIKKSYQRIISPRNVNSAKSNYIKPNVTNVPQASPRQNMNAPQISKDQPKQLSPQIINTNKVSPKISPRRENSVPNDKTSSKPSIIGTCKIPAVNNNGMSKSGIRPPTFSANTISRQHHTPTNVNTSPQPSNVGSNKSINEINPDKSFLEMSRKIEEQEKRLLEEALQGKKHDSRPSSSASTNGEIIVKEDSGAPSAAANIPTSKSVDFKGALRLTAAGRSTSTRIPMYGRTASVASTLHRVPKPRPNIITKALPPASPKDTSNDPWGDNCF